MRNYFMQSERIGFSIFTKEDLNLAIQLWTNEKVCEYICATKIFSNEEIKERLNFEISNQESYNVQYWPIFLLESNKFMGVCGLRPYDISGNIYEIGIHLCEEYWSKGYALEAVLKVMDYACNTLKIKRLYAGHNPNNIKSRNILTRLGFQYYKEEYYKPTGLMHPSYLYKYK